MKIPVKWEELRRHPTVSTLMLLALAGLTGWCVFNLQVVSLLRLLEGAGIESLPSLMFVQAACSWGLLRAWGGSASGSSNKFFLMTLGFGLVVSVLGHGHREHPWWFHGGLFIVGQVLVAALRMGIHVIFSRRISVLGNPQVSTQLAIAEEAGFMAGVLGIWLVPSLQSVANEITAVLPFVGGATVILLLGSERRLPPGVPPANLLQRLRQTSPWFTPLKASPATETEHAIPSALTRPEQRPAFFGWLVALFSVVASLKSLQWFGMAYGLSEASRHGLPLITLFSRLSMIQSALTLGILVASLGFSSRIPTWGTGFRVLLGAQALGGAALALLPIPYALMGGEALRKVLERGFLSRSLQLLTSTLPEEQRFESRHFMERWSTTLGTAMAGALAWLTVQGYVPMALLWSLAAGLALGGLFLRRQLFDTLCDFHVARLRQTSLGGVLQACEVLGNPDCRSHHAALTNLLERSPRPAVRKGLLQALGRMRHAPVVPALLANLGSDREDIQVSTVRALAHYRGHEINLALLKTLRGIVRSDLPLRLSLIRGITERLGRLVVPYLLETLEDGPDERVAANAVEILAELAHEEKDDDLKDYLAKFLDSAQPSRVRVNVIVALYGDRVHGARALEAFDRLITSDEPKELDASAYIAGVLNLRGHENFVWERSARVEHSNVTLLVSLLRLGNPLAASLLADCLASPSEAQALGALVRLSMLPARTRAQVFYQLIERAPGALDLVLLRMRKSQRDFETDRALIREEVKRLGLVLIEENAWAAAA